MNRKLTYLLGSAALLALWQYAGSCNPSVRLYISTPYLIIVYCIDNHAGLSRAFITTLFEATIGLAIATAFSFAVMYLSFLKPKILEFILPLMVVSQVIPIIILAPFFMILLGIGVVSKIAMAAAISFFPIFINSMQGYKAIAPNIHELMAVYKASIKFRIHKVYFPLSMPSIMAGLKVSSTLAVIGAIVAEFTGAKYGIGKNLFTSSIRLDPDLMMSSLFLATLIGLGLYCAIGCIEKRYGGWYCLSNLLTN